MRTTQWLWPQDPLPGDFHGQRSLVNYSSRDHRVGHHWATDTFSFPLMTVSTTNGHAFPAPPTPQITLHIKNYQNSLGKCLIPELSQGRYKVSLQHFVSGNRWELNEGGGNLKGHRNQFHRFPLATLYAEYIMKNAWLDEAQAGKIARRNIK